MQEKPGISLTVLHLFCSKNTCVTLAGETRTLGLTTPEVMPAAERCSGSLWARCYCGSLEQAQAPLLPPLHCLPLFHKASWEQWLPTAAGTAPRSHLAWLHMTCSSKPPKCLRPQILPHPRTYNTYPHSDVRKAPFSLTTGQFHITSQTSQDNTEKLELHVGSGEAPDGVQGGLWDVNMGLWSRGD